MESKGTAKSLIGRARAAKARALASFWAKAARSAGRPGGISRAAALLFAGASCAMFGPCCRMVISMAGAQSGLTPAADAVSLAGPAFFLAGSLAMLCGLAQAALGFAEPSAAQSMAALAKQSAMECAAGQERQELEESAGPAAEGKRKAL